LKSSLGSTWMLISTWMWAMAINNSWCWSSYDLCLLLRTP
jgi:hypothetical protein